MRNVEQLVRWSTWHSFEDTLDAIPTEPGVYLVRQSMNGPIVYVGMAGERKGKGLRDRFWMYGSGKAATSGLGREALDRVLSDPAWVHKRLTEVESGDVHPATWWARAAIDHWDLHVRWVVVNDRREALELKQMLLMLNGSSLW